MPEDTAHNGQEQSVETRLALLEQGQQDIKENQQTMLSELAEVKDGQGKIRATLAEVKAQDLANAEGVKRNHDAIIRVNDKLDTVSDGVNFLKGKESVKWQWRTLKWAAFAALAIATGVLLTHFDKIAALFGGN